MSKRHRKSKEFLPVSHDSEYDHYDLSMYVAPKGKKPKGRQKRETHKRAYYDD